MPLFLTEAEVTSLVTMPLALDALEEAFAAQARGEVTNQPRRRVPLGGGAYNLMAAGWPRRGIVGHKSYVGGRGGAFFHVMLYGTGDEGLLAVMEANRLGQVRTGAASGLATKHMARPGDVKVGVIGAGYQAETQLEAVAAVRRVRSVKVFSRTPQRREDFARRMSGRLQVDVSPADSGEDCVEDCDVIVTITGSAEPVLLGEWLRSGVHINAAGSNSWLRRELDTEAVARCDVAVVDDVDQAKMECGELMRAADAGRLSWDAVIPLSKVVAGSVAGRDSEADITLFESQGVALEDVAVAHRAYKLALERGVGVQLGAA